MKINDNKLDKTNSNNNSKKKSKIYNCFCGFKTISKKKTLTKIFL